MKRIIRSEELSSLKDILDLDSFETKITRKQIKQTGLEDIIDSENGYIYPFIKEKRCVFCLISDTPIPRKNLKREFILNLYEFFDIKIKDMEEEIKLTEDGYSETLEAMTELLEELSSLYELSNLIGKKVQTFYDFKKLSQEIHVLISACGIFNISCSHIGFIDSEDNSKWNISSKDMKIDKYIEFSGPLSAWEKYCDIVKYSLKKRHALIFPADKSLLKGQEIDIPKENILITPVITPESKNIGIIVLVSSNGEFAEKHRNFINVIASQVSLVASLGYNFKKMLSIQKLEREMELASDIQKKLLPKSHPFIVGWDIYGDMNTAREVGGDYFDYFIDYDNNTFGVIIADVSGKGISASLIMATFRGIIRSIYNEIPDIIKIFEKLNISIREDVEGEKFVTAFFIRIDLDTGKATYIKAGHNPVIYKKKNSDYKLLEGGGLFVGMFDDMMLKEQELFIEEGDRILLYTDGAIELVNEEDKEFTLKRLGKLYQSISENGNSLELIKRIFSELSKFKGNLDWFDDVTIINISRIPYTSDSANFKSKNEELRLFSDNFLFKLEKEKNDFIISADIFNIRLIIDELVTNAIQHGNGSDPEKYVHITWKYDYRGIFFIVRDEGNGFDWEGEMKESKIINLYKKRGRGLLICHNISNTFFYNKSGNTAYLGIYWREYEKNINS